MNKNFWKKLKNESKDVENSISTLERKRTGSFYTDLDLTDDMMSDLVDLLNSKNIKPQQLTFLEPCVGTGNFVFSYLKNVKQQIINKNEAIELLNNIYVADINKNALSFYISKLKELSQSLWNIKLSDEYFETHVGSGLLINVMNDAIKYIPYNKAFKKINVKNGFDIIATNPPYKNIKAEISHYNSLKDYNKDKDRYSQILKVVNKEFTLSNKGVLNMYKLFVEEILTKYSNEKSIISLLIPSTILSDKTCDKLREYILKNSNLVRVKNINENNKYIDACQSISTLLIDKSERTKNIEIVKDFDAKNKCTTILNVGDIKNYNANFEIVSLNNNETKLVKKLSNFAKVKDLSFIHNMRGELDLTTNINYVLNKKTDYQLLRGRNISNYHIVKNDVGNYVSNDFVNKTSKKNYIVNERIACQQISNVNKKKRVNFALVPKNYVLGNSCNFISVDSNQYNISIYTLMALFNTNIINWYFKIRSSNNHINNYEIAEFPVSLNMEDNIKLGELCDAYLKNNDAKVLNKIEELTNIMFGLTKEEAELIC